MDIFSKKLIHRRGAVMMYVVMALTIVAAIAISITLVATNLYSRTAVKSSDEQAYLLAKSIGQCFAADDTFSVNSIISYLEDNPTSKVTAKASVYFDPASMAAAGTVNKNYLTGLAVTDAIISFRLDEDLMQLYGDVTVNYNGATATATLVMSGNHPGMHDRNMAELFDIYDVYATQPGGQHFAMTGGGGNPPDIGIYNDKSYMVESAIDTDINGKITTNGAIRLTSSATKYTLSGGIAAYGDLTLYKNLNVTTKDVQVNGNLQIGVNTATACTVTVTSDIYCFEDISVINKNGVTETVVSGNIYAEGNITITNAYVSNLYATSGTITVQGCTVGNISTQGNVVLKNCIVNGTVYAGKLSVTNSSIYGNVTVEGSAMVTAGNALPNGDLDIIMTADAASDMVISKTAGGSVYCSGNLRIARRSATRNLTIKGSVEVGGGVNDPLDDAGKYPYVSTIEGNLVVHDGIKTAVRANSSQTYYYNLAFLIGLYVKSVGANTGNVVLDWAVPEFVGKPASTAQSVNHNTTTFYSSLLGADKATVIDGTLFVCTQGSRNDGLAGHFSLFQHYVNSHPSDASNICLNHAVLNNVMVGSTASYNNSNSLGDVAVWGGTIKGNILAHHISLVDIACATGGVDQKFYARSSLGERGDINIDSIYTMAGSIYATSPTTTVLALNDAPTTVFYGVLDATGEINIGCGVVLETTADMTCAKDSTIGGTVKSRIVVGNGVTNDATLSIGFDARLGDNAETGQNVFVNGNIKCITKADMRDRAAIATAFITGYVTSGNEKMPFDTIYQYSRAIYGYAMNCTIVELGDGIDGASLAMNKTYATIYDKNKSGIKTDTTTMQYIELADLTSGKSLVNLSNSSACLYVSVDCTIGGNLNTTGYVCLQRGVNLRVEGNMRCRGVFIVDSGNNLATICKDTVGTAMAMEYIVVGGSFECIAERADCTIGNNCTIEGNTVFATTGTVTFSNCSINSAISAVNAHVVVTDGATVAGKYKSGSSVRRSLTADTLAVEDSIVYGSIYILGASLEMTDSTYVGFYAPHARVDIRSCQGADINKVAQQLVADNDTLIKGNVYLLGGEESAFSYTNSGYSTTVYSASGDVALTSAATSLHSYISLKRGVDSVHFTYNGAAQDATILTDEERAALQESIDEMCVAPTVVGNLSDEATVYLDVLSYLDITRQAFAYTVPGGVSSKVNYVIVTDKGQMSLANETYWNTEVLPLKWVFPGETDNTATTVSGELVRLNPNTNTSAMSVSYKSLSAWSTAKEYVLGIFESIKTAVKDNFELAHPIKSTKNAFLAAVNAAANTIVSMSAVSRFAGISTKPDTLYRYSASKYNENVKAARGSADILVTSVSYLAGDSSLMGVIRDISILGIDVGDMLADWLEEDHPTLYKILDNIPWVNPKYEYRPCGVFFFNSGFVPAEVFTSYTNSDHTAYSKPADSKNYRTNYSGKSDSVYSAARDNSDRWRWGGKGVTATGSAADCTWTFFTCTDPANPYTSAAKDLHIVLPKHTYLTWVADKENCVHIIGNGRVFLYLQEDTNIQIVGNYWSETSVNERQVFGGYRYVRTENGKTVYYNENGGIYQKNNAAERPVSVKLDYGLVSSRELQPRMFIIGTGAHITFEVRDFNLAAYVYMPNGQRYDSAWKGTTAANNTFIISNTSTATGVTSNVYGMYVADVLKTTGIGNPDYKTVYYRTAVDLSDTTIFYNTAKVTTKRTNARYRLSEFWTYPDDMPLSGKLFYYKGLEIH